MSTRSQATKLTRLEATKLITGSSDIDSFYIQVHKCKARISKSQREVRDTSKLLFEKRIWPDQCERISVALLAAQEHVQELSKLFVERKAIPEEIRPFRYTVLTTSYHVESQIGQLLPRVVEIGRIGPESSRLADDKQATYYKMEQFCRSYEDLLGEVNDIATRVFAHTSFC